MQIGQMSIWRRGEMWKPSVCSRILIEYLNNFTCTRNVLDNLVIVCVRACVRVCVCLYSSTVKASSVCKISKGYLRVRINDLVLWILVGCFVPSSIISVSDNVIFHLQRRKLPPKVYWRQNERIQCAPGKDYIYWYRI